LRNPDRYLSMDSKELWKEYNEQVNQARGELNKLRVVK